MNPQPLKIGIGGCDAAGDEIDGYDLIVLADGARSRLRRQIDDRSQVMTARHGYGHSALLGRPAAVSGVVIQS
jgi:2-polyprenyl-6-methoxyphenol hydroxylase-like FAD-dependent oxidoreductase